MINLGRWDHGESGFQIAMRFSLMEPGTMTIQLTIESKIVQEILCEIVEP